MPETPATWDMLYEIVDGRRFFFFFGLIRSDLLLFQIGYNSTEADSPLITLLTFLSENKKYITSSLLSIMDSVVKWYAAAFRIC